MGVVHRDVKPANLMVDSSGHLWVTDFGLAMTQADAKLTMTGDLVGTLRYMSPEQASGRHRVLDHHTDIYSLGVTLYELLTLRAAFPDHERYKLLHRIANDEPRPPRQLNKAIPRDLETVVLKAMSKEPQARYATARELADDLRRFLQDMPVRARRPSPATRVAKWSRRHQSVVWSAAAVLLIAVVALTLSTVLIARAWQKEGEQAERARRQGKVAQEQRERAEANLQKAMEAVDQMLTEVGHEHLADTPHMEPVRRALLEKALAFYEGFLRENSMDPQVRRETGRAHMRVGSVSQLLGDHGRAEKAFRNAIAVFEKLQAEFPDEPENRYHLAESHYKLGGLLRSSGRSQDAEKTYRHALSTQRRVVDDSPKVVEYRTLLALIHNGLGALQSKIGRLEDAERMLLAALDIEQPGASDSPSGRARRHTTSRVRTAMGSLHVQTGQLQEAEKSFRAALTVWKELAAEFPKDTDYARSLATIHHNLAIVLRMTGRHEEAEKSCRTALAIRSRLAGDFPSVPEYRRDLAGSHFRLGALLWSNTHRREEAEKSSRAALDVRVQLVDDFPDFPEYRADLALSYDNRAAMLSATGRYDEAERFYRDALSIWKQLAGDFPAVAEYQDALGAAHYNLGGLLNLTGRQEEAAECYKEALSVRQELARDFPEVPGYRKALALSHLCMGRDLTRFDRHREAEKPLRQAQSILQELTHDFPEVSDYQDPLATSHRILGNVLSDTGRHEEAEKCFQEALRIRQQLAHKFPGIPNHREGLAGIYNSLGAHQCDRTRQYQEAEDSFRAALSIVEQLARDFPTIPSHQSFRGTLYFNLSNTLEGARRHEEAEKTLRQALSIHEQLVRKYPDIPVYRSLLADTYNNLGFLLGGMGRYEDAVKSYRKLLPIRQQLADDFPTISYHQSELAKNCHCVAKLLFACPADSGVRDADWAIELASKAVKLRPKVAEYWHTLGLAYQVKGDCDQAIASYAKAIELDPEHWMHSNRGFVYAETGQFEKAAADFKKVTELRSDSANAHYHLALVELAAGDAGGYRNGCARMLGRFAGTKDAAAGRWVAWSCALAPDAVDDLSGAVAFAEQAVKSDPKSVFYLNTLGAILFRAGEHDRAIGRLEEADQLVKEPDSKSQSSPAYTWFFLAMAHQAAGLHDEANKWFNKAAAWTDNALREHDEGVKRLPWNRRFTLKLLREEAEATLNPSGAGRTPKRVP